MTDEQYVRSVWERRMRLIEPAPGRWVITNFNEIYNGTVDSWLRTPAQNWAAAAEFTRSRMEDIRQLREEIAVILEGVQSCKDYPPDEQKYGQPLRRILARLESELARLTTGIKPEVLEQK